MFVVYFNLIMYVGEVESNENNILLANPFVIQLL